ncbi:porin [Herbaspirillum sp. RTI4]|uniref:porin n=1 Tax=Herbaspirillum sp. RTI4 TaxID=3048640 RepID=UPI002AB3F9A0|nr:porin [Herbaspirillum sp. RTI4]MDY7576928.1 porin [Herbaspirillum sp. RTI4]MEA9983201.1 porin [Herbaspirillum sp. RTI4]
MKKSMLALAVLGAFAGAAQAQSSVTIYGIVDTGVTYTNRAVDSTGTNTGSKFGVNSGILSGSRIGFKGNEDLGGGLKAVFQLESGFSNDNGQLQGNDAATASNLFRRKSVVGLAGDFGTVLVGRQADYAFEQGAITSVGDFGGITSNVGTGLSRLQGTRTNNSVRYDTNVYSGFMGSAIYGFGEQAGSNAAGQAFGAALAYANGPLNLSASYYQSKNAAGSTSNSSASDTSLIQQVSGTGALTSNSAYINSNVGTALRTFTLAAKYNLGNANVYGNWSRVKQPGAVAQGTAANFSATTAFSSSTTGATGFVIGGGNNSQADLYEIGGNYALSPSLKLMAAIEYSKLTFVGANTQGKLTQYNIGADYMLSKRTDVYTALSFLNASNTYNPGIGAGSIGASAAGRDNGQAALSVGVRHTF